MTIGWVSRSEPTVETVSRVGLFGLLGSGNIGNDASMEAVLGYLRIAHPEAIVDAMCMGPDRVMAEHGIAAIQLYWSRKPGPGPVSVRRVLGKGIDVFRTLAWVRRHDVIIVPGMGVLEATLPLRASGVPYAMFVLCASGKICRTKVALVSVGASMIGQQVTRWLFDAAARLASYRSYRDVPSRDAMRDRGVNVASDLVFPDLVFGLPVPSCPPGDPRIVGVGVMAYYGGNDDRDRASQIYAGYIKNVTAFIRWLADSGRAVRVFSGDATDDVAVGEIMTRLGDLAPGTVTAIPVGTFGDLIEAMAPASTVVATRYHNVMCALKLGKPTISIGYARKNVELMNTMGLANFCQSASALDLEMLKLQFNELERESDRLGRTVRTRVAEQCQLLDQQFMMLSTLLVRES
jgi:polysaccharide pyruvyl transferase WcaK-like protein